MSSDMQDPDWWDADDSEAEYQDNPDDYREVMAFLRDGDQQRPIAINLLNGDVILFDGSILTSMSQDLMQKVTQTPDIHKNLVQIQYPDDDEPAVMPIACHSNVDLDPFKVDLALLRAEMDSQLVEIQKWSRELGNNGGGLDRLSAVVNSKQACKVGRIYAELAPMELKDLADTILKQV